MGAENTGFDPWVPDPRRRDHRIEQSPPLLRRSRGDRTDSQRTARRLSQKAFDDFARHYEVAFKTP